MSIVFRPRRAKNTTMQNEGKKDIVLAAGEMFVEFQGAIGQSNAKVKFGDGVSKYSELEYALETTNTNKSTIIIVDDTSTISTDAINHVTSGKSVGQLVGSLKRAISLVKTELSDTINSKCPFNLYVSSGIYGYKRTDGTFVAFKSQADIDAAIASAKVGTAQQKDVLTGYTFTNRTTSGLIGQMPNRGNVTKTVRCDETYTIPLGYHAGSGKVTGVSLASQTGVDSGKYPITPAQILNGYQGWVNGNRINGEMENQGAFISVQSSLERFTTKDIDIPAGYHNGGGYVRMPSLSSQTFVASDTAIKPEYVLIGKEGWANGNYITGTFVPQGEYHLNGDATVNDVLDGKFFYSDNTERKLGTMRNYSGWKSENNNCNATTTNKITLNDGYYKNAYVEFNSLKSQTGPVNGKVAIDASHVVSGYAGWVNGVSVEGNFTAETREGNNAVVASTSTQTITPSANNKYLSKVEVKPTPLSGTKTITVSEAENYTSIPGGYFQYYNAQSVYDKGYNDGYNDGFTDGVNSAVTGPDGCHVTPGAGQTDISASFTASGGEYTFAYIAARYGLYIPEWWITYTYDGVGNTKHVECTNAADVDQDGRRGELGTFFNWSFRADKNTTVTLKIVCGTNRGMTLCGGAIYKSSR